MMTHIDIGWNTFHKKYDLNTTDMEVVHLVVAQSFDIFNDIKRIQRGIYERLR